MRTVISFLIGLVSAASVVALGILVAQNGQSEQLTFMGNAVQESAGWLVAGAAALGFVLAFLLLIPGRLASAWRRGSAARQAQALEGRLMRLRMGLGELREQHAELQGRHQSLLEEHQQVLNHVLAPVGAAATREPVGAAAGAAASTATLPAAALPRTGPITSTASSAGARRPDALVAPAPASTRSPTLDERIRERLDAMGRSIRAQLNHLGKLLRSRSKQSTDGSSEQPDQASR